MRVSLIVITLLGTVTSAYAQQVPTFIDGNKLYFNCTEPRLPTTAYSLGVADTYQLLEFNGEKPSLRFCIPNEVQASQIVDVVCAYLKENPATRHQAGARLVTVALAKAWPCH